MKFGYVDIPVSNKTVIAFDLDDTLYYEIDFLKSAYREIAQWLDPATPERLYCDMFSRYRSGENVFVDLKGRFGVNMEELIAKYRSHYPNIEPATGTSELIEEIRRSQGRIAVITDGRSITQRNKLKALGLENVLDTLVISEEFGSSKPEQRNYRHIMDLFPGGEYWYIGDNWKKDFITPNQLGWKTVGLIDNGLHIHGNAHLYMQANYRPHYLIENLTTLRIA